MSTCKFSPTSEGFASRPPPELCPWIPLGDQTPCLSQVSDHAPVNRKFVDVAQGQPDGQLKLTDKVSRLAVLTTGPTAVQNLSFSSIAMSVTITISHFTIPHRVVG